MIIPMSGYYFLTADIVVRLTWFKTYPNEIFNKNDILSCLKLKDIYLSLELEWRDDPDLAILPKD
jgi:hypothetical protein